MFPLPVGVIEVSLSRSNEVSSPATVDVEVPGQGEAVEIDVLMVPR